MSTQSFLLFLGVYATVVVIPGPVITAMVMRSLAHGFRSTIAMQAGLMLADSIQLMLVALGLAALAQSMGEAFLLVKIVGALYLVYLGYKYWTTPVTDVEVPQVLAPGKDFLAGLALGLGNPKAIAFWVALVPTVVDIQHITVSGYAAMLSVTLIVGPGIDSAYALLAARARKFFRASKARKRLNQVAGTALIGAGVAVAVRA